MNLKEIQTAISEQIAIHEEGVKTHTTTSNAGAYHRGQVRKLSQARQFVKDSAEAEERYAEMAEQHETDSASNS